MKQPPAPPAASIAAPAIGPPIDAIEKTETLIATAFGTTDTGTVSGINDCLAGMSMAKAHPARKPSARICQSSIAPVAIKMPSTSMIMAMVDRVATSRALR